MPSRWRDLPGFPGYQIDPDGAVRSLERVATRRDGVAVLVPGGPIAEDRLGRVTLRDSRGIRRCLTRARRLRLVDGGQ